MVNLLGGEAAAWAWPKAKQPPRGSYRTMNSLRRGLGWSLSRLMAHCCGWPTCLPLVLAMPLPLTGSILDPLHELALAGLDELRPLRVELELHHPPLAVAVLDDHQVQRAELGRLDRGL